MYKLIRSIVNTELQHHESVHKYMQLDQREGMPGSMGCIDNTLIDQAILEDDDTKNNKNLSSTWIDVEKAFDSVSHVWLIEVLKMHKINEKLVAFLEDVMKIWTITLELRTSAGNQEIGPLIKKSEVYSKVTHSELSSLLSASIQSRGTSEELKGTAFLIQRTQRQRFVLSWKT